MKKIIFLFLMLFLVTGCQDEHTHYYVTNTIEPTCTTKGYTEYSCECGDNYIDNYTEKIQHNFVDKVCTFCNYIDESESIGLSFELNEDNLSYSLVGIGDCKDTFIIIPSEHNGLPVTKIKDKAFSYNNKIKSLVIANSITEVGTNVLKGCNNLEELITPYIYNGYIGYLFGADSSSYNNSFLPKTLKSVTIKLEENIYKNAFTNCTNITKIVLEENIKKIEDNAFYNCEQLLEIILPSGLNQIGDKAFYHCINLKNIYFNGSYSNWFNVQLGSVYSTPMYYGINFYYFDGEYKLLTNLNIPNNIKIVNDYQLYGFECVENINIGNNVEHIGIQSLVNLNNLKTINVDLNNDYFVSVDGVLYTKDLNMLVLYPCSKINEIYTIHNDTKNINEYAFYSNNYLSEIIFGNNVCEIGKYAFAEMDNLCNVVIPESVTVIEEGLFYNCTNLDYIYLPDSLKSINTSAFEYCSNLEQIFIPKNVEVIQAYAFRNCSKLSIYCEINSKPSGWIASYWNVYPSCPVYWSQTR